VIVRRQIATLLQMNDSQTYSAALTKLSIWMGALMVPLYDILLSVLLLIVIDFFTGIGSAIKRKEGISSRKMRNTLNKFLFYSLTLLAAHIVEVKITPALPWLNIVSGFVALTELRSIFENFNVIFGLNIWTYVKGLIRQTKAGEEILNSLDKSKDKEP